MTEHPILFSGPMVRAILDGRKTQTRRVIKAHPAGPLVQHALGGWYYPNYRDEPVVAAGEVRCPYGNPGDALWVRECWGYDADGRLYYREDTPGTVTGYSHVNGKPWPGWKPSIHMPKSICRLRLTVTDVRVGRVQDISRDAAVAEGVEWNKCPTYQTDRQLAYNTSGRNACLQRTIDYIGGFHRLWDSINAKRGYGWLENPWVWCVTFKRLDES